MTQGQRNRLELLVSVPFVAALILIVLKGPGWLYVPIVFSAFIVLPLVYFLIILMIRQSRSSR